MLYVFTYVQNLKNEQIKEKQTHNWQFPKRKGAGGRVKQMKGVELQSTNKSQGIW